MLPTPDPAPPADAGPAALRDAVAAAFGVAPDALVGPSRALPLAMARHAAAYALHTAYGYRLTQTDIGALLGGRHHTTVAHSIMIAFDQLRRNRDFAERLVPVVEGAMRAARRAA